MANQTTTTIVRYLRSQFGHPRGALGGLAGFIMAHRASNRLRNARTLDLLDVGPGQRVLEVGCGPGLSLEGILARSSSTTVVGVDRSRTMLAQAARRNRGGVRSGRLVLREGDIEEGVAVDDLAPFDRVLLVNVIMFFQRPVETLGRLRTLLCEGGRIAVTHQPRAPGSTDEDARRAADIHCRLLEQAGYANIKVEVLPMAPVAATSVLAER